MVITVTVTVPFVPLPEGPALAMPVPLWYAVNPSGLARTKVPVAANLSLLPIELIESGGSVVTEIQPAVVEVALSGTWLVGAAVVGVASVGPAKLPVSVTGSGAG